MGIYIPSDLAAKKTYDTYKRVRRWIVQHTDEVRTAYIDWYVSKHDDLRRWTLTQVQRLLQDVNTRMHDYMIDAFTRSGLKMSDIERHLGTYVGRHYFARSQWQLPTASEFAKLRQIIPNLQYPTEDVQMRKRLQSVISEWKRLQISDSQIQNLGHYANARRIEDIAGTPKRRLVVSQTDYRDAFADMLQTEHRRPIVVYCDPPYRGTTEYAIGAFDSAAFDDWLREKVAIHKGILFLISEYNMPADFECVFDIAKRNTLSATANKAVTERLFVHKSQVDLYYYMMRGRKHVQQTLF